MATTKKVLETLISWMAQSANSPISRMDAEQLLLMLKTPKNPKREATK
jgi:hypothetical protein